MTCMRWIAFPLSFLLLVTSGLLAPRVSAASQYTVTDVGTLVGTSDGQFDSLVSTAPNAINENGVIAAAAYDSSDKPWIVGFTSIDGKIKRIGREKGISNLLDVNDAGAIAGWSTSLDDTGLVETVGTIWRDGERYELKELGREIGQIRAINNSGAAAGDASPQTGDDTESTSRQAILWEGESIVDLGTLGGDFSTAIDINESGVIVGRSNLFAGDATYYPYVWESGQMRQLETLEGASGVAYKINDDGIVVGSMVSQDASAHAVRWVDDRIEVLPELLAGGVSRSTGINNAGVIVGWSAPSMDSTDLIATIWDGDAAVDLNTLIPEDSGYTLLSAADINDAGQIVVNASHTGDDATHGVLLDPVDDEAAQVVDAVAAIGAIALRD